MKKIEVDRASCDETPTTTGTTTPAETWIYSSSCVQAVDGG
ncbi:MAG TPA: hypothetical protein VHJ20_16085 [Polyangia bacterium]|nr:hypothetical protein [Polyangia bacterium]